MATLTPLEGRLLDIPSHYVQQIHVIIEWLVVGNKPLEDVIEWSSHRLTLTELVETTIVDPDTVSVVPFQKIALDTVVELLIGVVELHEVRRTDHSASNDETLTSLRFVEGVQEELLSERFHQGPASSFAVDKGQAKNTVLNTCLALLVRPDTPEAQKNWNATEAKWPLALYAALFWPYFFDVEHLSQETMDAIRKLFQRHSQVFKMWIALLYEAGDYHMNNRHADFIHTTRTFSYEKGQDIPPIVWASAFNVTFIVEELFAQGNSINETSEKSVSALYMAVYQKHFEMTAFLLQHGADVGDNYQEPIGKYEYPWSVSPLYNACHRGYPREWIDLLLRDPSKHGQPGWRLEVAMSYAARFGHIHCLQALVDAGADLNKGSGIEEDYGSPLQAACDWSNEATVRWLLDKGANPNATGGHVWLGLIHTALHMAAWRGDVGKVRLLLEFGADPNLQGGVFGTALIAAIWNPHKAPTDGNLECMEMLLDRGAQLDVAWDMTPKLYELSFRCYEEKKTPSKELFGDHLVAWIKNDDCDVEDKSEGSESWLREKIDAKWEGIHEGQRQKKFGYQCGCMNKKAFHARHQIRAKIRKSAALISKRLHEAGVIKDTQGRYMLTAIQVAVAMERPATIQALVNHGAVMPTVIVNSEEGDLKVAEDVARMLRKMDSYHTQRRAKEGGTSQSGSQMLP